MAAEVCIWCHSRDVVTVDPDGDGCCPRCLPLLDPDGRCGHCIGDGVPVKMLGLWPACIGCLNKHHIASRALPTTRATIEAIAAEAGVTGDIWSLSLVDFVTRVLEARCMKLGLVKTADPVQYRKTIEHGRAMGIVANQVRR